MKYHIEKSVQINAPLSKVRPLINDFNQWKGWSPWNIIEPECEMDYTGTPGEVGQKMSWDGEIIGAGVQTVTTSTDHEFATDLEFLKPFKSKATTALLMKEKDGGTKVTWTMDSSMPFFLFFMVKMMKNWVGMDYERGLRMLKEIAEKGEVKAKTTNEGVVDYQGFSYVGLRRTCSIEEMPDLMKGDFERLVNDLVKEKGIAAEKWVTIYEKWDMRNMRGTFVAAVSDENLKGVELPDEYVRGEIKSSKALEIKHHGAYDFLGNAWSMGMMYLRAKKMKGAKYPFEQYWNSPLETNPEDLKTSVFFPIK